MTKSSIRRLKLQRKYEPREKEISGHIVVPWLNLSGRWLEQAGFNVGDRVVVQLTDHQLVITNCTSDGTEND